MYSFIHSINASSINIKESAAIQLKLKICTFLSPKKYLRRARIYIGYVIIEIIYIEEESQAIYYIQPHDTSLRYLVKTLPFVFMYLRYIGIYQRQQSIEELSLENLCLDKYKHFCS